MCFGEMALCMDAMARRASSYLSGQSIPSMTNRIHRITPAEHCGSYLLNIRFDDRLTRISDFEPILGGALFSALRGPAVSAGASIDPRIHTGFRRSISAFVRTVLHDCPEHAIGFRPAANRLNQGPNPLVWNTACNYRHPSGIY